MLDPKLNGIMPEVASMGASVSIVDFDRDGWPDIYVTNSARAARTHLYRNMHDGTFKDVADEMGIADVNQPGTGVSMGAVWGDYDNDGYEDLFLIKWGRPELFTTTTATGSRASPNRPGCPRGSMPIPPSGLITMAMAYSTSSSAATTPKTSTSGISTPRDIMPDSFEYAKNGGRKYLFHNLGNGKFEEVSAKAWHRQPPLGAGRCGRRPARHRASRPVCRQRLRRFGTLL